MRRHFNFPISTLIRDVRRLLGALRDPSVGAAVAKRLKTGFDAAFENQTGLLEKGGGDQSAAAGALGRLTQEQAGALTELERLVSAARRTATLLFPKGDPRLHAEFKVGINEPQDLASELERARVILTGCQTYAEALAEHGWVAEDTQALSDAIELLGGADDDQEASSDKKKGITAARTLAANALYKQCLTVQNAARLAYPSTKLGKLDGMEEARARFLLDEFPPRGGTATGQSPDPHGPPTPPTPAPA